MANAGDGGYGDGTGYSYGAGYGGYGSGYGYPPAGYGPQGYGPPPGPRTETMAILSLVFSCLSWLLCLIYGLGVVASIAGVILGFVSRHKIKTSDGMYSGEGLALAGIIVGAVNILVFIGGVVFLIAIIASSSS